MIPSLRTLVRRSGRQSASGRFAGQTGHPTKSVRWPVVTRVGRYFWWWLCCAT